MNQILNQTGWFICFDPIHYENTCHPQETVPAEREEAGGGRAAADVGGEEARVVVAQIGGAGQKQELRGGPRRAQEAQV